MLLPNETCHQFAGCLVFVVDLGAKMCYSHVELEALKFFVYFGALNATHHSGEVRPLSRFGITIHHRLQPQRDIYARKRSSNEWILELLPEVSGYPFLFMVYRLTQPSFLHNEAKEAGRRLRQQQYE